jgi:hypothetical protein
MHRDPAFNMLCVLQGSAFVHGKCGYESRGKPGLGGPVWRGIYVHRRPRGKAADAAHRPAVCLVTRRESAIPGPPQRRDQGRNGSPALRAA